ncbi:DUF4402 domain-containing protein [Fodinibius sp. AD559]|uniref:DUF4402 domain-containing protein n=1 Tax=Fodinibius sp. AD559 TaxID=3424179 RepID=UPI004046EF89
MKRLLQLTLILLITTGLTTIANAQNTATTNIKSFAKVQASINVSPVQALNFGTIAQGATSEVLVGDDAQAGQFTVDGYSGNLTLEFSFANGGELQGPGAPMTITFDNNDAAWGQDANTQNETWNPTNTKTGVNLAGASNSEIYVFIGGSIQSANNQLAGTYEETITLTATHN